MNKTLKTLQKTAQWQMMQTATLLHAHRHEKDLRESAIEKHLYTIRQLAVRPRDLFPEQETARFHWLRAEHRALAEAQCALQDAQETARHCETLLEQHVNAMKRIEKLRLHRAGVLRKANRRLQEKRADAWTLLQWGQR